MTINSKSSNKNILHRCENHCFIIFLNWWLFYYSERSISEKKYGQSIPFYMYEEVIHAITHHSYTRYTIFLLIKRRMVCSIFVLCNWRDEIISHGKSILYNKSHNTTVQRPAVQMEHLAIYRMYLQIPERICHFTEGLYLLRSTYEWNRLFTLFQSD